MKRDYNNYSINNIPEYIIELSNSIKEKKNIIEIIISNEDVCEICDDNNYIDYIINYLNILLNGYLIDKNNYYMIYFYYLYDSDLYHINFLTKNNKYKLLCIKNK